MFKKKPLTTRVYRYYRDHQSEVTGVVKPLSHKIVSVLSKLPISLPHRHDPAWKRTIKHWRRLRRIVFAVAAAFILLVLPTIYLTLRNPKETEAAPWATTAGSWTKRKQVTLTNNSGQTFEANTTYAININTQELVSAGYLNSDCSDLRIYYQPNESTTTKLAYYFDTAAGATNCSNSTSTKVYFPLQANLSNSSSTGAYYIYYGNTAAASEASVDAFDVGSTQALMVCPFNGDTECINGDGAESPTTETGAIRYGGSKSAVTFDGTGTDYIDLGSPTSLDDMISGKKITFESWVKVDRIGCHQYWTSTNFGGSGGGWWAYWGCSVAPTGNFTIQCNTQDASSTPTTALPTGEWFHYAATYDDTGDQKVHIFVNGTEVSYTTQNACTGGVISDASQNKYIWHDEWSSGSKAVGEVDEFRISDVIRYSSNFTPQTEPFIRDEHTKLLLHFDENGDDPRNTGKAIDDSGSGNHGTITGAKYVAGLVGVDASTSDSGNVPSQSYADHSGVFIEEGTTNLVTNPSFENGTAYDTNWQAGGNSFSTFTPGLAKRNSAGPFAAGVLIQGDRWGVNGAKNGDLLTFPLGSQVAADLYHQLDRNQGTILFWYTPEFDSSADNIVHGLFAFSTDFAGIELNYDGRTGIDKFYFGAGNAGSVTVTQSLTAGSTYLIIARWSTDATLDGTNYLSLSVNDSHTFGGTTAPSITATTSDIKIGQGNSGGVGSADGIIEGFTVYRRPLFDGTYGVDVGNGDEIFKINSGSTHTGANNASTMTDSALSLASNALVGGTIVNETDGSSGAITANTYNTITATLSGGSENDWDTGDAYVITGISGVNPVTLTGGWDVVFALPTNDSTGALTTGSTDAWSHPHASNLLYTDSSNTGGFMMNGTYTSDGWADEGTPSSVSALSASEKIYGGGYKVTSDAANEGIYYAKTVSAGNDWVIRAVGNSDGTCAPKVILYDQTNGAEIGHYDGTTGSTKSAPDIFIFTGEAPTGMTSLRVKLINTASSGTCYWHQVELLANKINNPSLEVGSGDPWLPTDFSQGAIVAGETSQETASPRTGASSWKINSLGAGSRQFSYSYATNGSVYTGDFVDMGSAFYGTGSTGFYIHECPPPYRNYGVQSKGYAYWNYRFNTFRVPYPCGGPGNQSGGPAWIFNSTGYMDDFYLYKNDAVTLTVTPATSSNSVESGELRVDGSDLYSHTLSGPTTSSGTITFDYTPRHSAADVTKFGESTPFIATFSDGSGASGTQNAWSSGQSSMTDNTKSWTTNQWVGYTIKNLTDGSSGTITANTATNVTATLSGGTENDWDGNESYYIETDDFIKLYWSAANTVALEYSMAGSTGKSEWDATSAIAAGTTYTLEVAYTGSGTMTLKVDGVTKITLSSIPAAFGTAPTLAFWGSNSNGLRQGDATFLPQPATMTDTTTAPYYKFGVAANKIDNTNAVEGRGFITQIDPNSTASHTLSAYVYNGTSGAVGGTVDNTVAQLVWEGTAQSSTTYTDMGGGWWRLTYSAATTDATNDYGVQAAAGKIIYIDGVQLEEKAYATTYTDGSLGTGYSWSGATNASTSSRTLGNLTYTSTSNLNNTSGSIALWYKPNWSSGNSSQTDYIISNTYAASDNLTLVYQDSTDQFVFRKNETLAVNQTVTKGKWYFLVASWDASNIYLSVNGAAPSSTGRTANNLPSSFSLGYKVNWSGLDAGIAVSDLRTYGTNLSSTEIADLYYSGLGSHQVQSDYTERFSGTEAPVMTWHLDEGYGTSAHDTTIKGNDGTISGAVWASDTYASPKQGKSLQFDGSNDYVYRTYSSDDELDPGTLPFSVSTWFKSPSSTGSQRNLISRYNSSGYKLYMNTSGNICFAIDDDSTWGPDDSACSTTSFADSKWHLVTAIKEATAITVYVDGVKVATNASLTATGHLSGSDPTFYVGIDSDGTSNPWSGFIDEVRVYNHALTTAEILAEVSARGSVKGVSTAYATEANQGSLAQGLLGYWKMNESSGNVSDSSGNGLTLTNNGTTTFVTGRFANGSEHVPASSQYFSAGSTVSGVKTVSFWVNPDNTTNYYVDLNGTAYIQSSTGTISATGFTNPVIYVNGAISSTITADTWSFVTISSDTEISATAFAIGKVSTNFFDGTLDEVRIYNRALSPAEVQALYNYAPGPVAEYKFDEGTGQSAYDSSGNGNAGTLGTTGGAESTDPTWTQGKFGKALNFDGTDDYASAASFTPANSGTIGLWVKPDVVANRLVGSNGNFEIRVNAGQIQADIFESTVGVPWTSNISADTWTYLTVTWDSSGTFTRKLYFNGVLEVTNTNPQDSVSTTDLSFGTTTGSGEYFDGTLDNVKIYNYVRTPQQIVEDMNAGHPAPGSPVGSAYVHYKFDEMQGSTANNSGSSGSGKNGSITSGTWTKSGKQNAALTLTAASSITATISSPGTTNTFALWVYPTTSAASKTIVSDGTDTLATDSSSRPTYGGCTGTAISTDTWTHIIAVSNGSGSCSLYQNGALTASSTTGVDFGTALNIGASSFVGSIDDFKLYTVAMTADQAKTESNQGTAAVLGAVSTDASGNASWSSDRSYCPPGDTTGTCGPVAEYKFDEKVVGDAQTIIDTSGNGYTATTNDGANNTGMSCATPGKYGASCTFDAVDDLITSTNVAYKSNSTGTVTAWFKNLTSTGSDVIFWLGDKDVTNTYFSIELRTSNVIRISNRLSGTWEFIKETGTSAYSLGVWNHLVIVQDGTSPKMYLNGKLMTLSDVSAPSNAGAWFSTLSAIDKMSIGAAGFNTPNAWFDGSIDQVKVFNYAFTPEQVAWDYNQGKPLAYYKFDECTGATLHSSNETYDSNLNATWTGSSGTQTSVGDCSTGGTAWGNGATGKSNGSLNFDGTDDKVQVVQPVTQARFSYSFWMKPSSLPGSSAFVVSEGFSYTNTNYILLNSSGDLDFRIFSSQIATSNGPITTGNWYHVVGTYDGTNGKLYINGQLVKTAAATKGGTPDRFSIGGGTDGTNFFTGQIDEVKVYSYALSQQQILTDYNAGAVNYAN